MQYCLLKYTYNIQLFNASVKETGFADKTSDMLQITAKLYHVYLYQVHITTGGIELVTFKVDRR